MNSYLLQNALKYKSASIIYNQITLKSQIVDEQLWNHTGCTYSCTSKIV